MAKRRKKSTRKKATVRRRSYTTRARRGTRAGMKRRTARRAYAPARRRARRNPKGPLSSPAVQYSLAASVGFLAASYADTAPMLNPVDEAGDPRLPFGLKGSVLAGVITLAAAQFALKGKNKSYAQAVAVGMFSPSVINMVKTAWAAQQATTTGGAYHLAASRRVSRLAPPRGAARGFANASRNLDNAVA